VIVCKGFRVIDLRKKMTGKVIDIAQGPSMAKVKWHNGEVKWVRSQNKNLAYSFGCVERIVNEP